ncbi:hypothetical protein [Endozoicomonas ascidiicola]|uniref:hypothetical protein n=1 Tax=Endozoicomonas ascidiicola TaxID=1698521 RepID=UPI000AF8CF09|nr:hypothetical protein [Endozoicomonas ascidiicola]
MDAAIIARKVSPANKEQYLAMCRQEGGLENFTSFPRSPVGMHIRQNLEAIPRNLSLLPIHLPAQRRPPELLQPGKHPLRLPHRQGQPAHGGYSVIPMSAAMTAAINLPTKSYFSIHVSLMCIENGDFLYVC